MFWIGDGRDQIVDFLFVDRLDDGVRVTVRVEFGTWCL